MNLFTYGSLMFPEVWERVTGVTGLTSPGLPARLSGYAARRIRSQSYPALIPAPEAVTDGVLYLDVSPEALARLDDFEGGFYRRILTDVNVEDGAAASAWVYLAFTPEHPDIQTAPWDRETFARHHLRDFLTHDPGFHGQSR